MKNTDSFFSNKLNFYLPFFRQFKDTQIQLISEIMEQVYNMGSVVAECEVMLEFERSGREHMVLPTNKCKLEQVKAVSAK